MIKNPQKKGRSQNSGVNRDTTSKGGSEGTRSCFACGRRWQEVDKNALLLEPYCKIMQKHKAKGEVHQEDETRVETESDEYTMFNC